MASDYGRFKPLAKRKPTSTLLDSKDTDYWKTFNPPEVRKEVGGITSIDFSPVEPYDYLIASSSKINFFTSTTFNFLKTYSKFKQQVLCAKFRHDGRMVIGSTETGMVHVFNYEMKKSLREIIKHQSAVHSSGFTAEGTKVFTCSDDKLACVWDVATGGLLNSFSHHQDSVRCSAIAVNSPELLLTGCYDHQARIFDIRANDCIRTVNHGGPIEDALIFPAGNIFITAGGHTVKVWDLMAGGRLLADLTGHHKTVTSLCFHQQYSRLISGSLDKHIKVYDTSSYTVVHSSDVYDSPITSVATSPDGQAIVVGMADGTNSAMRQRAVDIKKGVVNKEMQHTDYAQKPLKPKKLEGYNRLLMQFKHSDTLDDILKFADDGRTDTFQHSPEIILEVIEELIRRNGFAAAIAGREGWELVPILEFVSRYITNPNFTSTCSDVLNVILDMYSCDVDRLSFVNKQLQSIQQKVSSEASFQKEVGQLLGTIGGVMAMARGQEADN